MLFILGDCAFLAYRNEDAIAKSQRSGSLAVKEEQEGFSAGRRRSQLPGSLSQALRLFFFGRNNMQIYIFEVSH